MKDKTLWWCENCHASGVMPWRRWVSDVVREMTVRHNKHDAATLLHCEFKFDRVRVQQVKQR